MSDAKPKTFDYGRLELTLDPAVLNGPGPYKFTLCGHVLFKVASRDEVPGVHVLKKTFVVGPGAHHLTIAARPPAKGGQSGTSYPIEVPTRLSAYAIGTIECRVESESAGPEAQERAEGVGFQLSPTTDSKRFAGDSSCTSCCSTKA